MRLYYHKTDGGAEYLCSSPVPGTDEGSLGESKFVVRVDGDVTKDVELLVREKKKSIRKKPKEYVDEQGRAWVECPMEEWDRLFGQGERNIIHGDRGTWFAKRKGIKVWQSNSTR